MNVVGKSTYSGLKTGLYLFYHHDGENLGRYIKQRTYVLTDGRITGYVDTKHIIYMTEPIFHNFELASCQLGPVTPMLRNEVNSLTKMYVIYMERSNGLNATDGD